MLRGERGGLRHQSLYEAEWSRKHGEMNLFPVLRMHQRGETDSIVALVSFVRDEIGIDDHIHFLSQ